MWNWRIIVIVPQSSRDAAEQAARAINSTGPDYDGNAFTLPLSAGGSTPATHIGLYTSATDDMVEAMASALPEIAGAKYWRHDAKGILAASNVTEPNGQPWGWNESLSASGLKLVSQSFP